MAEALAVDESSSRKSSRRRQERSRRRHHDCVSDSAVSGEASAVRSVESAEQDAAAGWSNERTLTRRSAVRERRRRTVAVATSDGIIPDGLGEPLPRPHLFLDDEIRAARPVIPGEGIEGLEELGFDAGRFVAVIRQRRDLLFGMTDDDLFNVLIADDGLGNGDRPEPTYPVGEAKFAECVICLEWKNLHLRACCKAPACDECLKQYLTTQVTQAIIKIQCIGMVCDVSMHRDEILARLDNADKARYAQFLLDANCDPLRRTCPRCNHVTAVDSTALASSGKLGLMVECSECQLQWCFPCHAPWHPSLKCSEFRRGDKLLKAWAREQHFGQVNAQKCPKCKFYIQRTSGCDHMTCSRCKTDFCYRCGERFRELKFVGNHYSKLSIFGCKYRFKPTQPVQRRLIRGSIFAAQLLAVPALGALALGAGAVVASVGSLVLPFYAGYKLHKRLERRRSAKRRRRAREAMWRKLEDMRWRGEELDISHPMLTELDTTQIIRSFIGIDIGVADGTSTADDAMSGLTVDDSDSESSSDDSDDYSLHIRDEACQTGEDEIGARGDENQVLGDTLDPVSDSMGSGAWATMFENGDRIASSCVKIKVEDDACCARENAERSDSSESENEPCCSAYGMEEVDRVHVSTSSGDLIRTPSAVCIESIDDEIQSTDDLSVLKIAKKPTGDKTSLTEHGIAVFHSTATDAASCSQGDDEVSDVAQNESHGCGWAGAEVDSLASDVYQMTIPSPAHAVSTLPNTEFITHL